MGMLDAHFRQGGQFITGEFFTLADVVLGLAVHRWLLAPSSARIWTPSRATTSACPYARHSARMCIPSSLEPSARTLMTGFSARWPGQGCTSVILKY